MQLWHNAAGRKRHVMSSLHLLILTLDPDAVYDKLLFGQGT